MTTLDFLYAIGGIIAFCVNAYLIYRGNTIFDHTNRLMERQNEILAHQEGIAVENPTPKIMNLKRYWPMGAMLLLTILTWTAVGYDIYDRHYQDMRKWTDLDTLEDITARTFKNETVVVDGKHFYGPTFDNVTFIYNGTAGFQIDDAHFVPPPPGQVGFRLGSRNQVVKATIGLSAILAQAAGCSATSVKHFGPVEMEGVTPPTK
ncbi:MAG: hypothetical protein WCF61_00430 [Terriglobales bacterium]